MRIWPGGVGPPCTAPPSPRDIPGLPVPPPPPGPTGQAAHPVPATLPVVANTAAPRLEPKAPAFQPASDNHSPSTGTPARGLSPTAPLPQTGLQGFLDTGLSPRPEHGQVHLPVPAAPSTPPARSEILQCQLGTWSRPPLRPVTDTRGGQERPALLRPRSGPWPRLRGRKLVLVWGDVCEGCFPQGQGRDPTAVCSPTSLLCAPRGWACFLHGEVWMMEPVSKCRDFTRKSCGPSCHGRHLLTILHPLPPWLRD